MEKRTKILLGVGFGILAALIIALIVTLIVCSVMGSVFELEVSILPPE